MNSFCVKLPKNWFSIDQSDALKTGIAIPESPILMTKMLAIRFCDLAVQNDLHFGLIQ